MSEPTTPKITDAYWFEWSKEHLDSSLKRRDAAFATLQTLVIWLWGIYTTFAAVGFALSEKSLDPLTTLAVGAASVLLIAVYWASVWGQMPVPVEFDPRSPTEINAAHAAIIQQKDGRLKVAMVLSLIAAASVAVALLAAGASRTAEAPTLEVAVARVSGDPDAMVSIAVTAQVAAGTSATVDVIRDPGTDSEGSEAARSYLSTQDGLLQVSVPAAVAKAYRVSVTWKDGDVERRMSRDLDLPDRKSP